MKNKYIFVAVLLLSILAAGAGLTSLYVRYEQDGTDIHEFHVVTSFYPMYIAALNIIGECDGVSLENLSEPQTGCLHDYQLTTEDMRRLSAADAFVINGGGIENFLSEAAGRYPKLSIINASARLHLIEDNAHAWMSIPDYMIQVQTIADQLAELDAVHYDLYKENCRNYLARLEQLRLQQEDVQKMVQKKVQEAGNSLKSNAASCKIIIFHEAFAYAAQDYGLTTAGSMDLDEERQVSAGEAADMIRLIKEQGVSMILAEEQYGKQMCETIQKETDVPVVYLDPCVRGAYDADSYLRAMHKNIRLVREVLEHISF